FSNATFPLELEETGPTFTVIVPCHVFSSIFPVIAAPGRQRATFSGSVRKLHTCSVGDRTTNVLTISNAMTGLRRRGNGPDRRGTSRGSAGCRRRTRGRRASRGGAPSPPLLSFRRPDRSPTLARPPVQIWF